MVRRLPGNAGSPSLPEELRGLAERVRDLCLHTAVQAYEDAATAGLCHEGAWEAAVDAIPQFRDSGSTPA